MKDELFELPEWTDKWLAELDAMAPDAGRELLDAPIAVGADAVEAEAPIALGADAVEAEAPIALGADAVEAEVPTAVSADVVEVEAPTAVGADAVEAEVLADTAHTVNSEEASGGVSLWQRLWRMPRRVKGAIGACAMLVVVIAILFAFGARGGEPRVYIIEVNPSVALIAEDGVVRDVKSLGSDGDVLLGAPEFDSLVVGKSIDRAVVEYVELCVKYGYFTPEGDALRLSTEGESGDLSERVEAELAERGLLGAVVCRGLTAGELAEALGISEGEISAIGQMPTLFRERLVTSLDESELSQRYEEMVVGQELMEYILSSFRSNTAKLRQHAELLDRIWTLDEEIISHGDNPTRILFIGEGYFDVLDGGYEYTAEFGELMGEMQTILDEYAATFGVEITDGATLTLLHTAYSPTATELLIGLVEYMSEELFAEYGEQMLALLCTVGACGKELEDIFVIPATREDFLDRLEALNLSELDTRLAEFGSLYDPVREAVSSAELEDFKEKVIAEYGSPERYFEQNYKK